MSNMCLCRYSECEKKDSCKRYITKADNYDSFADFQYICNEETNYKYYWQTEIQVANVEGE